MSDTSEITNGCLTHYDSSHIQTRRDFMGLCKYNRDEFEGRRKQEPNQECMAKILRLVETLTDHAKTEWRLKALAAEEKGLRKPKEPKCYPVTLSNGVIVRLIYETFGESTVRNSLNYLLEIGYIGRSQETKNAVPLYWLEQEYVQYLLKLQAEVILSGFEFRPPSYQGLKSYPEDLISNPSPVISRPGHSHPGSEIAPNNIDNKDDISSKTEKEREGADAPTRAEVLELEEKVLDYREQVKRITDKHKAVSSHSQVLSENDEDISLAETAHRMPAVQVPGARSLPLAVTPLSGGQGDTSVQASGEIVPSQDGAALVTAASPQSSGSGPRASGLKIVPARPTVTTKQRDLMPPPMAMTPKQIEQQLEQRRDIILTIYAEELGRKPSRSKANLDGAMKLAEDEASDEDIRTTIKAILADSFLAKNLSMTFVHTKLDALSRKSPPAQNNHNPQSKDQEYGVSGLPKLKPLGSVK